MTHDDDRRPPPHDPERLPDIHGREDVARLVRAFYDAVLDDPLIGRLFTEVARIDLATHLPVMAEFWESVLLTPGVYRRNALRAHRDLHARSPLRAEHFDRWLELWTGTVRGRHAGPLADRAVARAQVVARALLHHTAGDGRPRTVRAPVPVDVDVTFGPPA
ncbi:group III truncated hemoglobin [Streptomyces scabiei]|uniref:group III truncated hemoglobin n=1 Tax=Streptomyces scabiei TaxID=1930 RepID=UPI001B309B8A|nr:MULTISPECIES: group III truncated hemoglobin [Streptomyces]MBP5865772.1 group III truncated hemoglobin [Streptomyces sp. LBUM 1484]MBP5873024.1 group III truncated hemoglobin [Streptomyces sp. LBUM 1485]MBP5873513.1 group III truncated hemoglobin [Streptomyces sp. LBUM 1477]MBP5881201.1 group III truncated hemoglobin [Streptomyces sp. LBUM 1487]MBP5895927.1 group III truncated hemoglobin [Streptomyces sp. LBUM 1481]